MDPCYAADAGQRQGGGYGGQQLAAATLLGTGTRERPHTANTLNANQAAAVDLGEPVPFNQSQLLYNQPMNATVKGPESLAKSKTFVRYADMADGRRPGDSISHHPQASAGGTHTAFVGTRGGFDKSLNDRDA